MSYVHNEIGRFYGVGLGPGDPNLITLKAVEILNNVDVIFVPLSGEDKGSYARHIVEVVINKPKEIIELMFPMIRDKSILLNYWKESAKKIASCIEVGRDVAFVTIGDPFIYSTYIYLLKTLKRYYKNIQTQTIPGISSINAAAARVEVPLVEAEEKLAIIPVGDDIEELKWLFDRFDTVVLMKVGSKINKIIHLLNNLGLIKNSILINHVSLPQEQIITNLTKLNNEKAGYLSIIIVKKEF
jgi:precorrin-2/cobalt-factor-2 C20-methyltransferase